MMNENQRLKDFDKIFNTNTFGEIKFENVELLKNIYCMFKEKLYTPSLEYKKLLHKYNTLTDKLLRTLSDEQKDLFIKLSEIKNQIFDESDEQIFIFGFIMAKELERETKIKKV